MPRSPDPVPPTWRAAASMIQTLGVPTVFAGVLLWFLLSHVIPSTEQLASAIRQNSTAIDELSLTSRAQAKTYITLEESVRKSMDISDDNNRRLRQMMGETPWTPPPSRQPSR